MKVSVAKVAGLRILPLCARRHLADFKMVSYLLEEMMGKFMHLVTIVMVSSEEVLRQLKLKILVLEK